MLTKCWRIGPGEKLLEVYRGIQVNSILITVPDVVTSNYDSGSNMERAGWLQSMKSKAMPHAASFLFEHKLVADDSFTWKNLFNEGGDLLDALLQLREYEELNHRPIILSAHGLGGIIVKRAINLAHQQTHRFRDLIANIAGILFFGTPHSQSDLPRLWQNTAGTILRYNSKIKPRESINSDIASMLAEACRYFETAFDQKPVLSVYETQGTRIAGRVSSNRYQVVGKNSSKTNVKGEIVFGLDVDHRQISDMKSNYPGMSRVVDFIDSTLEAAKTKKGCILGDASNSSSTYSPSATSALNIRSNTLRTVGGELSGGSFANMQFFTDGPDDREDPKLPCHLLLLARNKCFFGRKRILEDIESKLSPPKLRNKYKCEQFNLQSFAICGPGGIGKTQIAAEYTHSRKHLYDAILWVQADEYAKLAQGFYHIAINLGLVREDSADGRDHIITREAVKSWLKNPVKSYKHGRGSEAGLASWLLIFDNLDDLNILNDFWPTDSPGSILITSHDPLAKTHLAGDGTILQGFSVEEATEFLLKLTHREEEVEERMSGNMIADRLGGLPLALTQMAGVIARRDLSFAEFLQMYDEESCHKDLFNSHFAYASDRSGYQHTLASVWALETLNESATLLDILSLFDSDGIQERILDDHRRDISLPLPEYPRTNAAYQIARTELQKHSFITRDRGTKMITMHRLIQDTARAKMTAERFDNVFLAAVTLLSSVWPYEKIDWRHSVSSRVECEDLFPHVIRLWKLSERLDRPTSVCETDLLFPRLLTDAGWFSHERGNSQESQLFFKRAQQNCEAFQSLLSQIPPGDNLKELEQQLNFLLGEIHYNSGCISTEINEPSEALSHFRAFNSMMLKQLGVESTDRRLAISWNELGNGLMMNKQWEDGIDCFNKSIETLKKQPDFKKTHLSFPLVNLGFAYWILGQLEKAEQVCQQALLDRQEAFGVDDVQSFITGKLLHVFGNVRAAQGKMGESFNFHQRALVQYQKFTVGKNHHRTADVCIKVADHYLHLKDYQCARTLLNQALKIYGDREYYAPERARAKFKTAQLLVKMGEQTAADNWFAEALLLYRAMNPGDNREVSELNNSNFDDMITFWSR